MESSSKKQVIYDQQMTNFCVSWWMILYKLLMKNLAKYVNIRKN